MGPTSYWYPWGKKRTSIKVKKKRLKYEKSNCTGFARLSAPDNSEFVQTGAIKSPTGRSYRRQRTCYRHTQRNSQRPNAILFARHLSPRQTGRPQSLRLNQKYCQNAELLPNNYYRLSRIYYSLLSWNVLYPPTPWKSALAFELMSFLLSTA